MKSAEEILKEKLATSLHMGKSSSQDRADAILQAMEQYADQFKQKWVPVEEANLEDGKAYYVYSKEYGQHNDCIYNEGLRFFTLSVLKIGIRDVTHVMNSIPNPEN